MRFFKRQPDFIIKNHGKPYLLRWWIIPKNKTMNIYLHKFLHSDEDRALHDHPWWSCSIILRGGYYEHLPRKKGQLYGTSKWRKPGSIVFRRATQAHRVELEIDPCLYHGGRNATEQQAVECEEYHPRPAWTLFITGPNIRQWGFHCPKGWVHWRVFLNIPEGNAKGDEVGPGCE